MKRPDVFGALYVMSACCLSANRNPRPESMAAVEAIKTREQAEEAARAPGFGPSTTLASAAGVVAKSEEPAALSRPSGQGRQGPPDIVAKWIANSPLETLEQYVANLGKFYAIGIEIGTKDTLLSSNQQLHAAMTKLRIPHYYEEYDGDPHEQGPRADRAERPAVLREEPGRAGQSDQPADSAVSPTSRPSA
jgi:hypothetical protein